MASLTAFHKAALVLLALPKPSAAEVARHLTARELARLTQALTTLPDLGSQERTQIYREFQEGLASPFASLAESRPQFLASQLQAKWLRGGAIRLELGDTLFQTLVGVGRGYDYLRSIRLGPAWLSLDGPHHNSEIGPTTFRFLKEGEIVDQDELELDRFLVLDVEGEESYAGCSFRRLPPDQLQSRRRWSGLALDPAQTLAWRTRVLTGPAPDREDRPKKDTVLKFLTTAEERSTRSDPRSEATDWMRGARAVAHRGLSSLDLEQILAPSGPEFSPFRAAVLLWSWGLGVQAREALFSRLAGAEQRILTKAIIALEEGAVEGLGILEHLRTLNCWTEPEMVQILLAVLQGKRLPLHPIDSRCLLLRLVPTGARAKVLEGMLDQMAEGDALHFQAFYAASLFRANPKPPVEKMMTEQLILSGVQAQPDAPLECLRLASRHPLETALALRRFLDGSWAPSRLGLLAHSDPAETARRLVAFQPVPITTRKTKVATLLSLLDPGVVKTVKAYWRALADIPDLNEPAAPDQAPLLATVFKSLINETVTAPGAES